MTSEEVLEKILKIPEDQRTEPQKRTAIFLETIKKTPAAWEKVRALPVPLDMERTILGNPPRWEAT